MDKKKFVLVVIKHHSGDKYVTYITEQFIKFNMNYPTSPIMFAIEFNPYYYADKCNKNQFGNECSEITYHFEYRNFKSTIITNEPHTIRGIEGGPNVEYEIPLTKSFIDEKLIDNGVIENAEKYKYICWSDECDAFIELVETEFENVPFNRVVNVIHDGSLYKSPITKDIYESIYGSEEDI